MAEALQHPPTALVARLPPACTGGHHLADGTEQLSAARSPCHRHATDDALTSNLGQRMGAGHSNWRDLALIALALIAILSALESGPKAGPAVKAYRSAIRRQGLEAATIGGLDGMEAVLRQIVEAAPDQAGREVTLTEAWASLPRWQA